MSKYGTFLNQKRLTKNEYYEYKKQNKKYTDDLFPPNDTSIYSQTPTGEFRDQKSGQKLKESLDSLLKKDSKIYTIEWERISDRPYFNKIYNEKISHEQIEQGSLGDCYLISLMASISHFPDLIIGKKDVDTPHILYNYDFWDIGYYELMFFIDGEFKIVIIDDFIPFVKEKGITIFANSSENYFWVNLVEKAYSKICGGYTSVDLISKSGNKNKESYDHFQIFTGFKCEKFPFYDEKEGGQFVLNTSKADNIIKIIEENLSNKKGKKFNTMITTGTPDEKKGLYLEENYIPYQHSFSILDYKKIKINQGKNEMKLLLLNNPWGRNIYNEGIGPYCLENLNENVINLKPYIEYNLHSEDGCFWIDYETFLKNYISINVCKIPCNYNCSNYSLNESKNFDLPLIYRLKIEKKTNIFFNVNMSISENVRNGKDSIYLMKFLIINKIDNKGKIVKTYNNISGFDDLQVNYDLEEGTYIIWLYIPKRYFPESNKLNAHFMISNNHKKKFEFLDYDIDFKYIKGVSQFLFEQNENNQQKLKEKDDKMIKCIVDCKSLDGILVTYLANTTTDKKIICEPESSCEGFSPINYNEDINLKKINVTLLPGEYKYFIGISTLKKSMFAIEKINIKYSETSEKKPDIKEINFVEYLNKIVNETKKIKSVKYITNDYCYIRTNFNKNPDKRDEDNVFNYFLSLMTAKLKQKNLSQEKIKLITQNTWDKMKPEEKEKITKKYEQKKKELKNNVLKMQVLKYIKRNSVNMNNNKGNEMDNDIINMKLKTRLSHQFQFAKFEDDLDELEERIKNILPKIDYLKSTEKDEIEFDKYIDKQNVISSEFKNLLTEKITRENGEKIDKRKVELLKEYEPLYQKMREYFKKHDENMKLYNEINKEGAKLLKDIEGQVDIYNTKKLNMKKEINYLLDKFMNFMEEIKKLKLVQINDKCNREVKKAMEFFEDVKKMQNKLKDFVDELKDDIKNQQKQILPQDKFDLITKRQNELSDILIKLKDTENIYNHLNKLIEEENSIIKSCETLGNNIDKIKDKKEIISKIENYEKQIKLLAEKINKFQGEIHKIVELFNIFIKDTNDIRKQVGEFLNKFKEKNIRPGENMEKLVKKINELDKDFEEVKVKEMLEKNKKELLANWNKVNETFSNTCNKIKSLQGKILKKNNNISEEKMKEIKDKVNKEMIILEKQQDDIMNSIDKIKSDKNSLIEEINNISKEEENALTNIKSVYKNDINNITKENFKSNFEKYKIFNEKCRDIGSKINPLAEKCKTLFQTFNSFIKIESENRKKIYENTNILQENGIVIEEKIKKMINRAKEIFDAIEKLNLNQLNDLFNTNVIGKFKDMQNIMEIVSKLSKK